MPGNSCWVLEPRTNQSPRRTMELIEELYSKFSRNKLLLRVANLLSSKTSSCFYSYRLQYI